MVSHCVTYMYIYMYMIEYTKQTMYWKRKVIANRANCVDTGNNRKIESFRKYTMGFSKQMCHEWENNGSFYTFRKIYHGFLQTDVSRWKRNNVNPYRQSWT